MHIHNNFILLVPLFCRLSSLLLNLLRSFSFVLFHCIDIICRRRCCSNKCMMFTPKTLVPFFYQCSLLILTNLSNEMLKHSAHFSVIKHLLNDFLVLSSSSSSSHPQCYLTHTHTPYFNVIASFSPLCSDEMGSFARGHALQTSR